MYVRNVVEVDGFFHKLPPKTFAERKAQKYVI
jgi:hypothetical protein